MIIERSVDYPAIRNLLTEEAVYRRMANDEAPAPSEFPTELPGEIEYIVAKDDAGAAAVFLLNWRDFESAEIHFCFHARTWGHTVEIAQEFLAWLWKKTPMMSAVGPVPGYNALALHLAEKVGFVEFRREPKAVRKNGHAYDLIYTRIERPAA